MKPDEQLTKNRTSSSNIIAVKALQLLLFALLQVHISTVLAADIDTLYPQGLLDCPNDLQTWIADPSGPVFGNNSFGDKEKAQLLSLPVYGGGFMTQAILYCKYKRVGEDRKIVLHAYSRGPDGAPLNLLGSSDSIALSEIDTASGMTMVGFGAFITFGNEFFLSMDISDLGVGDTIALLGTSNGCGSGCVTWEKWSSDFWNPVCDTYNFDDIDMGIAAIVDWTPSGLADMQSAVFRLGPNPATDEIRIYLEGNTGGEQWTLEAWDLQGRKIWEYPRTLDAVSGRLEQHIEVRDWTPGSYLISLKSANHSFQRLIWLQE
jgi:hypothetical protein